MVRPKEACGVFGVYCPGAPVARMAFDGLFALQHRGQESAGIAVSDGDTITVVKDMGLVASVFDEKTLSTLEGDLAIGHVRYSTTGSSTWNNAQPAYRSSGTAGFAMGHNGNLTNTDALLSGAGLLPGILSSDSDLVAELLATACDGGTPGGGVDGGGVPRDLEEACMEVLPLLEGAFSFVILDAERIIGVRDPNGFRPLCLGRLDGGWVLASETPALDIVGATFVREVDPGEMVVIGPAGVRSLEPFPPRRIDPKLCIFEYVYFARPDSVIAGLEVNQARRRMGELLARQSPVEADLVMGVPDSGVPAAEGFAAASGIAYGQGLVKNRYIGRTFIDPSPEARARSVRRKLNPLRSTIEGKRLVVVDDSIVRGTTTRALVSMLRDVGAREVHLRISSPPFEWPCFYGIDTPTREELLASSLTIEEMREYLGVDSLAFLSLANLRRSVGGGAGNCDACLTGNYPIPVKA
jgi:amidophosphoribosyltransferase